MALYLSDADGKLIKYAGMGGSTLPILDQLDSESITSALSANQGRVLNTKIANEITAREAADNSLDTKITTETSRAVTAEGQLQTNINTEKARAEGIENALRTDVNKNKTDIGTNTTAISNLNDYVDDTFLPLAGGEMSGNITLPNNIQLKGRKTNGTPYNLLAYNGNDDLILGSTGFGLVLNSNSLFPLVGSGNFLTHNMSLGASNVPFKDLYIRGTASLGSAIINGNITVKGDITQEGSTYETHAEEIYSTKDYIYLREGQTGALTSGSYSGFEFIKYDGTNNGRLVIDNTGTARVGDVGDEQPLATRDESSNMVSGGVAYWDNDTSKLKTYNIKTATGVTHANYSNATVVNSTIPTMGLISYWNGAYNSNNSSNLRYSANGEIVGSKAGSDQTIEGTKRFKNEVIVEQASGVNGYQIKNTGYTVGNNPSSNISIGRFSIVDSNNIVVGYLRGRATSNGEIHTLIGAHRPISDDGSIYSGAELSIIYSPTGSKIEVSSNLQPIIDNERLLGQNSYRWKKGYFGNDGIKVGNCNIQYNSTTKALEFNF